LLQRRLQQKQIPDLSFTLPAVLAPHQGNTQGKPLMASAFIVTVPLWPALSPALKT
jgi:hypothetical protein